MNLSGLIFATLYLAEIPLSSTYSNGNPWLGWSGRWLDWPLMVDRSLAYSNTYKRPVEVEVDAERVPVIEYDVTGYRTGTAVKSGFGRAVQRTGP